NQQTQKEDESMRMGINFIRVFLVFGSEAKKTGLHAKRADHQEKTDVRVQLGDDPVFAHLKDLSIEDDQQIIEQSSQNAAHAIERRLTCQLLNGRHERLLIRMKPYTNNDRLTP